MASCRASPRMSRVVLIPASEIDQTSIRVARRFAIARLKPELRIDRTIRSGAVLAVTPWSCCPWVRSLASAGDDHRRRDRPSATIPASNFRNAPTRPRERRNPARRSRPSPSPAGAAGGACRIGRGWPKPRLASGPLLARSPTGAREAFPRAIAVCAALIARRRSFHGQQSGSLERCADRQRRR